MKLWGSDPLHSIEVDLGYTEVRFRFFDRLMVLQGNSATGKTWIFKKLSAISDMAQREGGSDPVSVGYFSAYTDSTADIFDCSRRVIAIDEAHLLAWSDKDFMCRLNQRVYKPKSVESAQVYLLISRGMHIPGLVSGLVELQESNGVIEFKFPLVDEEDFKDG